MLLECPPSGQVLASMALNKAGIILFPGSLLCGLHTIQSLPVGAVIFQVAGEIQLCSSIVLLD